MDSFEICTVVRYWFKVSQSTLPIPFSDLEVKAMDIEIGGLFLTTYCSMGLWIDLVAT